MKHLFELCYYLEYCFCTFASWPIVSFFVDTFYLLFVFPHLDSVTKTSTPSFSKNGKTAGQQGAPWETLVVFAINLKQLTVQMNMSHVMGNNT